MLLLDEPFAALDTRVRIELRDWLRTLNEKTHLTTLFVTHDQGEAMDLSQQVVVMNHGMLEQAGTPDEVSEHPASEFVASFIGRPRERKIRAQQVYVKLRPAAFIDTSLSPGVIEQLARTDGMARATVRLPSGERILVPLPSEELGRLAVEVGDPVTVDFGGEQVSPEEHPH